MPIPESEAIDATIQALGDLAHEHYLGSVGNKNARDGYEYAYDNEVINILDTPEARTLLTKLLQDRERVLLAAIRADLPEKRKSTELLEGFCVAPTGVDEGYNNALDDVAAILTKYEEEK